MFDVLGVAGWGVGGIEAEATMLDQPMSMVELAGPRRERSLTRVCGGGATHRPRFFCSDDQIHGVARVDDTGHQDVAATNVDESGLNVGRWRCRPPPSLMSGFYLEIHAVTYLRSSGSSLLPLLCLVSLVSTRHCCAKVLHITPIMYQFRFLWCVIVI